MPEFQGVPANPEWLVETEIGMDSVIHADNDDDEVHIVGSSSDALLRQNHISHQRSWGPKGKRWNKKIGFTSKDEAEDFCASSSSKYSQTTIERCKGSK
uniref:Putative ovule protein n=1 Tax=Solanum chacoense TaxID=4108 RepID=A0A0V0H5Z6_SOLCH